MNLRAAKIAFLIIWKYLKRNAQWAMAGLIIFVSLVFTQIVFKPLNFPTVVRIGFIGTYQEHDLPGEVMKMISTGLVESSDDGKIKPKLVSGWEVNNDATSFKFKLNDNLTWSDNTKIKSSDLDFAIPDTTVTFPDDKTVEFKLRESYSPLPSLLIKPIVKKGTLIGTGPYRILSIEKSRIFITKIILEPINPKLPQLSIRFYPNEKVAITGFNLGEVQALMGISNLNLIEQNPLIVKKAKNDYSKIVTVLFQTTDKLLQSRSLRQALAFQTPEITGKETANHPYPPKFWAYNSDSKKYLNNNLESKEALQRAKSQMSEDKLSAEILLTSTPNLEDVGKTVISAWRQLGFDAKLRVEEGIPQNFQALLITQSIPPDPDQYFLWHATQTKTNLSKYDSKRVDKDLEDGRKTIKEEDRKQKYFDFQKTLLEDVPAIFLYFPKYNIIYLKKVENLLNSIINVS